MSSTIEQFIKEAKCTTVDKQPRTTRRTEKRNVSDTMEEENMLLSLAADLEDD